MTLLTEQQRELMLANGRENAPQFNIDGSARDHKPVVKLFTPWGSATWLLTELDPRDPDIAFGLCDLGMGFPELGSVSLSELESVRGPFGLRVERDLHFTATDTLSHYTAEALRHGRIVA